MKGREGSDVTYTVSHSPRASRSSPACSNSRRSTRSVTSSTTGSKDSASGRQSTPFFKPSACSPLPGQADVCTAPQEASSSGCFPSCRWTQAKPGAAVPRQVELCVAATAVQLPIPLRLGERLPHVLFNQRHVRGRKLCPSTTTPSTTACLPPLNGRGGRRRYRQCRGSRSGEG